MLNMGLVKVLALHTLRGVWLYRKMVQLSCSSESEVSLIISYASI